MAASRPKSSRGSARKATTAKRSPRPKTSAKRTAARKTVRTSEATAGRMSLAGARKAAARTMDRAAGTARRTKAKVTKIARDMAAAVRGADKRKKAGIAAAVIGVTAAAVTLGVKGRK